MWHNPVFFCTAVLRCCEQHLTAATRNQEIYDCRQVQGWFETGFKNKITIQPLYINDKIGFTQRAYNLPLINVLVLE